MNKIEVDSSSCVKRCSGLIVTGFTKSKLDNKDNLRPILEAYNTYKNIEYLTEYELNGRYRHLRFDAGF